MILKQAALVIGALVLSTVAWGQGVKIDKQPVHVERRTFDPNHLPREMPKLVPPEVADCDAIF